MEGSALEELFAGALDPQVRIVPDARAEFFNKARLPDSRLTHYQHELALTVAHTLPATEEQAHVVLAPHERREGARCATGRAPPYHRGSDGLIELNGMLDALKLV